jgi:hypothetical protein
MATCRPVKYESKPALIEAIAQWQHESNLRDGGVFSEDGSRFSDIEIERKVAATKPAFVGGPYAFTLGLPGRQDGGYYYYVPVGYCTA